MTEERTLLNTVELEARYSTRKSFYKKAHVKTYENGYMELVSYTTTVATYEPSTNTFKILGKWSATTTSHIKEFALQNGVDDFNNTAQMFKKYLVK